MRLSAIGIPQHLRRGPLIGFAFFVVAIFAAYEAAEYVVAGDTQSLLYIAMAFIGGAIVVAILNNWRNGVYFVFAWLLFEDFFRKYLGNNMGIYFAKDILMAVVYISFFAAVRRKEVRTFRPPYLPAVLIFFWFAVMQCFNPAAGSLFFGPLGLKLYFYYMPLTLVGFSLFQSEEDLRRFFFFLILLAGIIAALGGVQSILGHTFLNPAVMQDDIRELAQNYRVAPISGVTVYRPTSVFVSAGRFAFYMVPAWLITFGMGGYLILRSRKGRIFVSVMLAILSAAVPLSASRGTLLWTAGSAMIASAAFIWGAPWRQGEARRVIRTLQRTLLVGGLAIIVILMVYPEALLSRFAFYRETLSLDSPQSELVYRVKDYPLYNLLLAFEYPRWPYGYGTGTASLGVQYIAHILKTQTPIPGGVENGYGTLILEFGILGPFVWLTMCITILICAWKVVKKLKGSPWFPLAFCIFWFGFLLLGPYSYEGLNQYQDFVVSAHFWLLLGVLFRLPNIALSAQYAAALAAAKPRRRWIV